MTHGSANSTPLPTNFFSDYGNKIVGWGFVS
jgi:hypothetical protein